MAMGWMLPTLLSCLFWGFWGLFPKLASRHIDPWSTFIFATTGNLLVVLVLLLLMGGKPEMNSRGILLAFLGGLAGSIGSVFYNMAAAHGRISVVVTLTGLYPLVTVIFSYFLLQEPLAFKDIVAMALAIGAIILISM